MTASNAASRGTGVGFRRLTDLRRLITGSETVHVRLNRAAALGAVVDLSRAPTSDVDAELLTELVLGHGTESGRVRAVRVRGARIRGSLNLESATAVCPLAF